MAVFSPEHLAFLDYEAIYSELQRYKVAKARHNVNITRQDLIDLLNNNLWYKLLIPEDELVIRSFEDYRRFEKIAVALLIKYFDRLYYFKQNHWESNVVGYDLVLMDDRNDNFLNEENDEYSISIKNADDNESTVLWLHQVINEVEKAKEEDRLPNFTSPRQGDMEVVSVSAHLYNPLLYLAKNNMEIGISPVALNENELKFVKELQNYIINNAEIFTDKELYLIRNRSKKGLGFFDASGFYPDFIMWLIADGKQYITFVDPHGMGKESIHSSKVQLYKRLKTEIECGLAVPSVALTSFILSPTKHSELTGKQSTIEEWNENHVLFMDDSDYIEKLLTSIIG